MSNWFGNLQLAYKYVVVFLSLLALTMVAGFIKVMVNRQRLKKAKSTELEAGPKEDTVELNQREKDEGDLFGIRAIEAGFYAGVAQSRPTSRAGSVAGPPHMSTSTLVGGNANSPLMKGISNSNNNSVLSLNLNATNNATKRASPPAMKLRPSEAEISGRRNHNGVDMALQVPPSPGHPRRAPSPTYGDSDADSEGFTSPRSMSPNPQHYAPVPKTKVAYHEGDERAPKSQIASFNNSPAVSPTPPAPRNPPTARLPTIPGSAMRKESRSPSPEYNYPSVQVHQPNNLANPPNSSQDNEPASAPQIQLQPRVYSPSHERDGSDASSIYSGGNRLSTFQAYQAYQKEANKKDTDRLYRSASAASSETYNLSSTDGSGRTSILAVSTDNDQRPKSSNLLAPGPGGKDTRLSEFYEAYYRNSTLGPAQPVDSSKQATNRQSTILEVDSPMASPMFPMPKTQQPGAAY